MSAEAYFAYVDLHITSSLGAQVIRIALGETNNYNAADVLLKVGETFHWRPSSVTTVTVFLL